MKPDFSLHLIKWALKKTGSTFLRGDEVCIFDFSNKFGEGWDWTWQVPRADFDNTLAQEVINKGIDLEFETEVIDIKFDGTDSITTVRNKDGETKEIHAKFVIDSSGYGRVLPRFRFEKPSKLSPLLFFSCKDINREEGEEGTLISFDIIETEVWLWVIPFSNGNTSLGIVGPTEYIEKLSENGDTTEALRKAISLSDYYVKRFGNVDFLLNQDI
jgi:flavin-dependent dehydrogenase